MDAVVRANALGRFPAFLESLGADADSFLARAGISRATIETPDSWVSLKALTGAYELAGRELGEPAFGIRYATYCSDVSFLGPLVLSSRHAENFFSALKNHGRYAGVQNTGYRAILDVGEKTCLRSFEMHPELRRGADQWIEALLMSGKFAFAYYLGEEAPLVGVRFRHGPTRPVEEYERDFGAPVLFGQESDGFEFDTALLHRPLPNRDAAIHAFMNTYLEERLPDPAGDVVGACRALLETLIPAGQARLEIVAEDLRMHPRTLQRRLGEVGSSFSSLVDEQRRAIAEKLMRDERVPLTHLAHSLGYSEQSAFIHAFRRWYDTSPSAWRKAALAATTRLS